MYDTYQTNRSKKPVCWNCSDSGEMMAGGGIKAPCSVCKKKEPKSFTPFDKRTKEYRIAHKKLMKLGLSAADAHDKLNSGMNENAKSAISST